MTDEDTDRPKKEDGDADENVPYLPNLLRMMHLLQQCWPLIVAVFIAKMLSRWCGMMENVLGGSIVDSFVAHDWDGFVSKTTALSLWYLVLVLSDTAEGMLIQLITNFLNRTVRLQFYSALMNDKSQAFYDESKSGSLASRLSTDCQTVADRMGTWLPCLLTVIIDIVCGLAFMGYTHWKLSIAIFSFLPFVGAASWLQARWESPLQDKYNELVEDTNARATETLLHSKTVRIFGQQRYEIQRYAKLLRGLDGVSWKLSVAGGVSMGFIMLSYHLCLLTSFWYGGTLVLNGELTSGQFLAFSLFALGLSGSMNELPYLNTRLVAVLSSISRVYSIIEGESEVDSKLKTLGASISDAGASNEGFVPSDDAVLKGHIEFKNVAFTYPSRPDTQVLQDFNLTIEPGHSAALVGPSGGGKSTVVSLLTKLYKISSGQISLDGHDIDSLNANWLRRQIGLVSQEPILFAGTVRENICYGLALEDIEMATGSFSPDTAVLEAQTGQVSQERLEEVAKTANAHDFISALPDGYDTMVGEHGTLLSAGQRQRIAIARAILRDPKILIADEATSALDNSSERIVQQALDRLMVGRTCIVIAHRLSTIRQCDPICYIGKGRIMESGSHAQLLSLPGGHYAKLHAFESESEHLKASKELLFQEDSNITADAPSKDELPSAPFESPLVSEHSPKARRIAVS